MNEKLRSFSEYVKGKKVGVLGVGVTNIPILKLLLKCGARPVARDRNPDVSKLVTDLGEIELKLGENYLDDMDEEILFKTPGIRYDIPALCKARENGCIVTSEMEVFFEICPARIIAVTGSDGKTTTTNIIERILARAGYRTILGGNIGKNVLGEIEHISKEDIVVLEMSSFQLQTMKKSPQIAVVTNISPNHLDWHTDMAEYIAAKENIVRYQKPGDLAVLNADNPLTSAFQNSAGGDVRMFSYTEEIPEGVYQKDGVIWYHGKEILKTEDIAIVGRHNVENYMAAIAAVYDLVSAEDIRYTAKNFSGVEHRIEFVREKDGVRYYNDSIATTPTRTIAGLTAFTRKVILIAGGYDKKIPFEPLTEPIAKHVKNLILLGQTAPLLKKAAEAAGADAPVIDVCDTFEEAVELAHRYAQFGDIVLLSPACASFGMFKDYKERGRKFKEIVNQF